MDEWLNNLWRETRAGWRFLDMSQLGRTRVPKNQLRMDKICEEFDISRWRLYIIGGASLVSFFTLVIVVGLVINQLHFETAVLYSFFAFPVSFILSPVFMAHVIGVARHPKYQLLRMLNNIELRRYQQQLFDDFED